MGKKIAFIKFAGLAAGGIEKYLQTIAIMLRKERFDIDFYYTNAAPFSNGWEHPKNSDERIKICQEAGLNLIPVRVDMKQGYNQPYEWIGTNFWELFDEKKYDFVQTGRGGYPEYPFNLINECPIIDSIHSFTGEDKPNIKKAILLCKWQADKWASNGGNISKAEIIPSIVYVPERKSSTLRSKLGIADDVFIYGLMQSNRNDIFSPISLIAYSKIESKNNCFVILGGCEAHRNIAKQLNLKNIYFIEFSPLINDIHDFLEGIDVFAHARSDGEVCSASIIEAQYHGKPVISHPAINMGHAEQIESCGKMTYSLNEYYHEMILLEKSKNYYENKKGLTLERYKEKYDYNKVEKMIKELYINL